MELLKRWLPEAFERAEVVGQFGSVNWRKNSRTASHYSVDADARIRDHSGFLTIFVSIG
jgi:hypothetical protein